jgi:hypothetical protein
MRKIVVGKKSGFVAQNSPVIIYDHRKKIFYSHLGNSNGLFYFNLPKGVYYTNNSLGWLKEPLKDNLPQLPKREKFIPIPKQFKDLKIRIGRNPNKASISVYTNKILVDDKILSLPLPNIIFVLFHEIGHFYFHSEKSCDLYAARQMLKLGFNPSQCGTAIIGTLSEHAENRKQCLIEKLF